MCEIPERLNASPCGSRWAASTSMLAALPRDAGRSLPTSGALQCGAAARNFVAVRFSPIATHFLDAATAATPLFEDPTLSSRWDLPSVLDGFTMGELAGHLARAVGVTSAVLARGDASGAPRPVVEYYCAAIAEWQQRADRIHDNARGEAALGPDGMHERWLAALDECRGLLADPPATVRTSTGDVLDVEDYLLTRGVELAVHTDDFAASLGRPLPDGATHLVRLVNDLLLDVARAQHGERAVLRALARRERDDVDALHVV